MDFQRRIDDQHWLSAREAAELLGIQVRSLYAYTSRGQVRSLPTSQGRARLYAAADVERLRLRSYARAGHGAVAAGALHWGEAVLDSAITGITPQGPVYRGLLATELASSSTFENVAELLWGAELPDGNVRWRSPRMVPMPRLRNLSSSMPMAVMQVMVACAAVRASGTPGSDRNAFLAPARQLIRLLVTTLVPDLPRARVAEVLSAAGVAESMVRALGGRSRDEPLFDCALILLADHELNASSFAARVAASTGANAYACAGAALATLSGPKHGGASWELAQFAETIDSPSGAREAVRKLAASGELPPGFGHTLYPHGDPRAVPFLELARRRSSLPRVRKLLAIADAVGTSQPNVDWGLAALTACVGAPAASASGIFAVARAAGWIAHAIEQRATGQILRPRARYTGPQPAEKLSPPRK